MARTLDDSMANKIVCKRNANREKTDHTPFEAWGGTERWEEILDRCSILPKNKRWRFAEDAMEKERLLSLPVHCQLAELLDVKRMVH